MTNDRAIDLIRRIKTEETHEREIDRHKAFDLAISALEKQIPKKVNVTKYDIGGNNYFCSCGNKLRNGSEYCDMCGCKLDWSDTE